MRHSIDPRQTLLFDEFKRFNSELGYKTLVNSWSGVFRAVVLELMPVGELAEHFHPTTGAPTKELYSMAGLILLKEFRDWSADEAAEAYMFDDRVKFALNLNPTNISLSYRTVERYERIFREDNLAAQVMDKVTGRLIEILDLDISKQRLDSTHVFSNMATFSRTRLMGVTIKRLLTQIKRHDSAAYDALPLELRDRYAPSVHGMFADVKSSEARHTLRQQVAQDMYWLIQHFEDDSNHAGRSTFKMLVTVFEQQCELVDDQIVIRKHTGGDVIQNPSDPDATYDGKKGPGYQAQLTETSNENNEVELITGVIPQTAVESDANIVGPMLAHLNEQGLLPDQMSMDTAYGSHENELICEDHGVEMLSPVAGPEVNADQLNSDDFAINPSTNLIDQCPNGHTPQDASFDEETGKHTAFMPPSACSSCPFFNECPTRKVGDQYRVEFTVKTQRLSARRREQNTEPFRETYRKRAGIEGTNSGIKRTTGMGRVRVRGRPSVFHAIHLKVTGWNLSRAASSPRMREYVNAIIA